MRTKTLPIDEMCRQTRGGGAARSIAPVLAACVCLCLGMSAAAAQDEAPGTYEVTSLTPARPWRSLYMDFGMRISRAPDGTTLSEPAIEFSRLVSDHLALGVGLTGGSAPVFSGERSAFTVAPSVDLYHGSGRLRGYLRLGMATQYRGGAQLPDNKSLALFGALGARMNLGLCLIRGRRQYRSHGCLTAGTEVRIQNAVHGSWLMDPAVLPQGASIMATSVTLGWEV